MPMYDGAGNELINDASLLVAPAQHRTGLSAADASEPASLSDTLGGTMPGGVLMAPEGATVAHVDVTLTLSSGTGSVTCTPAYFNTRQQLSFLDSSAVTVAVSTGTTYRERFHVGVDAQYFWIKITAASGSISAIAVDVSFT